MTIVKDDYWIVWFTGNRSFSVFQLTGLILSTEKDREKLRKSVYRVDHSPSSHIFQILIQSLEEFEELGELIERGGFKIISRYRINEIIKPNTERVFVNPREGINFLKDLKQFQISFIVDYNDFYRFLDFLKELSEKHRYKTYYINSRKVENNKITLVVK